MSFEIFSELDGTFISDAWQQIGYDQDECDDEQCKLDRLVIDAILMYQEQLGQAMFAIQEQIKAVSLQFEQLMTAFGVKPEDVQKALSATEAGNLKSSLAKLTDAFNAFKESKKSKLEHLQNLQSTCAALFDRLEIEERGEFAAVGDVDFTDARIQRFADKVKELTAAVDERLQTMKDHQTCCEALAKKLEVPAPTFNCDDISAMSMKQAEEYEAGLIKMTKMREDLIDQKKSEITKLWNILDVPTSERRKFTSSFKTIGASVVQSYTDEIQKLQKQRQEHLPEIVEQQKLKIKQLEEEMHLTPEQIEKVDTDGKDVNEAYEILDARYDAVHEMYISMKPFIELITERSQLLSEMEQLDKSQKAVERAIKKKKPVDQKQINKDEQARRRIRSLLPRLEKKLLIMLVQYQANKGHEFTWDGLPYAEQLAHIKLSESELRQAKSQNRKRSLGSAHAKLDQPERKVTSRRSLENNSALINH